MTDKNLRKPVFKKPCPNPKTGRRCSMCGGKYVCLQPERKKLAPITEDTK